MANVLLKDEHLSALMVKAILDTITPESREELLTNAIKSLMQRDPHTGYYSDKRTHLQKAFDSAVAKVAHDIALEEMKKPANTTMLREVIVTGLEKVLADKDELASRIARSIESWLDRDS